MVALNKHSEKGRKVGREENNDWVTVLYQVISNYEHVLRVPPELNPEPRSLKMPAYEKKGGLTQENK
jgi:hypothetical protein